MARGLYLASGVLIGSAVSRTHIADLAYWWTLLLGMSGVVAAAVIEVVAVRSSEEA